VLAILFKAINGERLFPLFVEYVGFNARLQVAAGGGGGDGFKEGEIVLADEVIVLELLAGMSQTSFA